MPPSLIARGEGGGAFYNGARVISRLADNWIDILIFIIFEYTYLFIF